MINSVSIVCYFIATSANVKEKMKPFCRPMAAQIWASKSALELIKDEDCPAWVLPSAPVLGRCLPFLVAEEDNSPASENKTVFDSNETQDKAPISKKTINGAVTALGAFLR